MPLKITNVPPESVYAMADGRVSFSGTAGGYGWLIIIDHPQATCTRSTGISVPVVGNRPQVRM